jgi:mono/diheme cytochrome c family protein
MRNRDSMKLSGPFVRRASVVALTCGLAGASGCSHSEEIGTGLELGPGQSAVKQTPFFGATVTLAHPPPAISGGTLLLLSTGTTAVASDPDRDQLYVVDLTAKRLSATIPLTAGDEPGRLVEDGAGRVHVALRGGGAVVTLDPTANRLVDRQSVCAAPRGIDYDSTSDNLLVACNGGEVVTVPAAGGAPSRTLVLEPDLRDVVIRDGKLFVSRLRQADVLELDPNGHVTRSFRPPVSSSGTEPDVAWRLISAPSTSAPGVSQLAMVHQRAQPTPVSIAPGGYGQSSGGCEGTSIVETTVTTFTGDWPNQSAPAIPAAVLPVDIAASPDGSTFAIVAAGNAKTPALPDLFFVTRQPEGPIFASGSGCGATNHVAAVPGQVTAVVFAGNDQVWVQTREPAALWLVDAHSRAPGARGPYVDVVTSVVLSTDSREDTGHSIVHSNSGGFIACASCHAEGGEDGRVWQFQEESGTTPRRRTQSLRGTIAGTAPYHWEGDMKDISTLAHEVFIKRMGGPSLAPDQSAALEGWLFAVPRPRTSPVDAASAARGSVLFHSSDVGCSQCHAGEHFTNNATLDVGTGGMFQVPSLIGVSWRAPYFHDGRAPDLVDRFNPRLAGAKHGSTSQLDTQQIDDLVHFLQTL